MVVFTVIVLEPNHLSTGVEAILGLGVLVLVVQHPFRAAMVLLTLLPFETVLFSLLLRIGVPAQVMRGLGFYKEAIVLGLALAAVQRVRLERPRFDALDKVAAAYLVLGAFYLVLPTLFVGTGAGAHLTFYARELGWRSDILYVGIFLVFRHLGLSADQTSALFKRVLIIAVVIAVVGMYEFARPYSFNHFLVKVIQVPAYQARVLHSPSPNPTNLLAFANGSSHLVRIGSILINYLEPGWYFIIGLALAIEMATRGRSRPWIVASIPILGIALVFNQSRAAILGGIATVLFSLRAHIGRSITARVRLSSFVALMVVVGIPVIVLFGLGHRFVGSPESNTGHVTKIQDGIHAIAERPWGRGLATSQGGGSTAAGKALVSQQAILDPENQWLVIGIQVGVLGLALYASALILMVRGLRPRTHDPGTTDSSIYCDGMRSAFLGILVGALVLPIFTEPVISWTVFGLCGLAVGAQDQQVERRSGDTEGASTPLGVHPFPAGSRTTL